MVRFDEYDGFLRACQRLFIGKVHFQDGFPWRTYFASEKRALIVANHGPILGPLVWVCALFPRIVDLGYGHFTYSAIAHPIIRNIPIFARIVGYEKRGEKRLRASDYIELFEEGEELPSADTPLLPIGVSSYRNSRTRRLLSIS